MVATVEARSVYELIYAMGVHGIHHVVVVAEALVEGIRSRAPLLAVGVLVAELSSSQHLGRTVVKNLRTQSPDPDHTGHTRWPARATLSTRRACGSSKPTR